MVYVLGVLTLVALIGLILIARTRGEFKRVADESTASSQQAAMDGVIRVIRETLHRDVWGPAGRAQVPLSNLPTRNDLEETNEPYDAPGPDDRWLASTMPYLVGDLTTGWEPLDDADLAIEEQVLAYHRVSYLGTDVIRSASNALSPFVWAANTRAPTGSIPTSYSDSNLEKVPILQTPPPGLAYDAAGNWVPLIPGSTTNVTIAEARAFWQSPAHQAALLAALGPGVMPRFPYFDTNRDGEVDLYDADGDGVPDSPISFAVPLDTADPNAPRQLYAVVRVVDHAGMLNVNVASSLQLTGGALTFDEMLPGLQRRGRRLTELLLDDAAHADDALGGLNRTAGLMNYRSSIAPSPNDPVLYDVDIVRRRLVGGRPGAADYFLYSLSDEASLRHRGLLPSRAFERFDKANNDPGDYRTIDRALRWSLLWTRDVDAANSYLADVTRWNRLNSNYQSPGSITTYEGYDVGTALGWRTLLRQDDPAAIRRPMFTTVSHEVQPPPPGVVFTDGGTPGDPVDDAVTGLSPNPVRFVAGGQPGPDVWMAWPVLDRANLPDLPHWMRVLPIDINMSFATTDPNVIEATKEMYVRYLASAMYLALGSTDSYQDIPLRDVPATQENDALNREWLAWQFAVNMADYRDSDGEPTVLEWVYQDPGGPAEQSRMIFGIEKQPFFTEAYAHLVAGSTGAGGPHPGNNPPDAWFFAVELFVPPHWIVPTANLYLRSPDVPGAPPIPLRDFVRAGQSPILDGGQDGAYFVLCGDTTNAPADLNNPGDPHNLTTFYRNSAFEIATDGTGRVELVYIPTGGSETDPGTHVLDVIGPAYSGGGLAGGTPSGGGSWAKRPPSLPDGAVRAFSLLRSTKGWRFTTCWHVYTEAPVGGNLPGPPLRRSLGLFNRTSDSLDDRIPESVWPTRVTLRTTDHEPLNADDSPGFASGLPYEAFDSVGEIGRMLMIGPARYFDAEPRLPTTPDFGFTGKDLPATAFIAEILDAGATGDLPGATDQRVAAGRVDFSTWAKPHGAPWSWRLLSYLTTQSPLFDGIDNDGDDPGDGSLTDLGDPTEGAGVLYRVAGRINLNTAPLPVLRSVPFMSLLPTSAEYTRHVGGGMPIANPAAEYLAPAKRSLFWDLAGAIVALREGRPVPLRLMDTATGFLQTVGTAGHLAGGPGGGGPSPSFSPEPFTQLGELMKLTGLPAGIVDTSPLGNHGLYRVDRFWADPGIALWNHKLPGSGDPNLGDADPAWGLPLLLSQDAFSPDFRYRRDNDVRDYVPIAQPFETASDPRDAAGIRGRDVFLARWANLLTTRSDVFTAYIALLDEDGHTVGRTRVTLDRSACFREVPVASSGSDRRIPVLPDILSRLNSGYSDDMR